MFILKHGPKSCPKPWKSSRLLHQLWSVWNLAVGFWRHAPISTLSRAAELWNAKPMVSSKPTRNNPGMRGKLTWIQLSCLQPRISCNVKGWANGRSALVSVTRKEFSVLSGENRRYRSKFTHWSFRMSTYGERNIATSPSMPFTVLARAKCPKI